MSKAKQVREIETVVARLQTRIRELNAKARGLGQFLKCQVRGGPDCGCGRKVFVAVGQNPPADWLSYRDHDYGVMYVCSDCARTHGDSLRDWGYERLGPTRSQRRRESQRRKRQAARERTSAYWQEPVVFVDPVGIKAYLGRRLEMVGAFFAAGRVHEANGSPPDLRYVAQYGIGTVYNPVLEVPPEFAESGRQYLDSRGIVLT